MHRSLRFTAVLAAVALPFTAGAQQVADARPISFGISAGLTLPMGDVSDVYSSGFDVTGHIWYKPAMFTNLSFRGDIGYDRFKAKESLELAGVTQSGTFTSISGVANAVYSFPQSDASSLLRPYVLGGLGFYNTKSKVETQLGGGTSSGEVEVSDTNAGLQVGGGVQFNLSGFSTFAEARFVNVFGDGSSARWIPITFGFRF